MHREQLDNHKYLCWLDQIRYLGRKSIFALLSAAADRTLFSEGLLLSGGPTLSGESVFSEQDLSPDSESLSDKAYDSSCLSSSAEKEAEDDPFRILTAGARTLYTAPESQLRYLCNEAFRTPARAEKAARLILKARKMEPDRCAEDLARAGITFCSFLEQGFPDRLRMIPDPPFGLYFLGNVPLFGEKTKKQRKSEFNVLNAHNVQKALCPDMQEQPAAENTLMKAGAARLDISGSSLQYGAGPAAAIIGARLASGYGREQARRFARRLASRGITIISGMARGIDGIAQKAALDAGGRSYAVLGCGVDICYPEENRELYDRLLQEGGIISEYPPGTYPEARLFPQRNRIISGLSDLVLVIEARKRSGTLITVDMALEQGREVYALPGRVSDSLSDGCNRLIRQGAGAATCPEDILEFFFGTGDREHSEANKSHRGREQITGQKMNEQSPAASGNPAGEAGEKGVSAGGAGEIGVSAGEAGEKGVSASEAGEKGVSAGETVKINNPAGEKEEVDNPAERSNENSFPEEKSSLEENRVKRKLPEECTGEDDIPVEKLSLDQGILRILSNEDETHIERLFEQIRHYEKQGLLSADNYSLSDVITCLIRMKIDGWVEETSAGYYVLTLRG